VCYSCEEGYDSAEGFAACEEGEGYVGWLGLGYALGGKWNEVEVGWDFGNEVPLALRMFGVLRVALILN
jgi:hypothetical protein